MDPTGNSFEPKYYTSSFVHGVDEKRRVQIPAKWRPSREGFEFMLILWPKEREGDCLRVLPPKEMEKMVRDLDAMSNEDPEKTRLKRLIGGEAVMVSLDKAGRICLPEAMAGAAGISNQAVLAGMIDKFEIWSPERYALVRAAALAMRAEAFRRME